MTAGSGSSPKSRSPRRIRRLRMRVIVTKHERPRRRICAQSLPRSHGAPVVCRLRRLAETGWPLPWMEGVECGDASLAVLLPYRGACARLALHVGPAEAGPYVSIQILRANKGARRGRLQPAHGTSGTISRCAQTPAHSANPSLVVVDDGHQRAMLVGPTFIHGHDPVCGGVRGTVRRHCNWGTDGRERPPRSADDARPTLTVDEAFESALCRPYATLGGWSRCTVPNRCPGI